MIKVTSFDSESDFFINHKNIDSIIVQADNRLFIKMASNKTYILKENIINLVNKIMKYDSQLTNKAPTIKSEV